MFSLFPEGVSPMLSNLVYRSRARVDLTHDDLVHIERSARERNEDLGVTGVLLFDGSYFCQFLEGPEAVVRDVYALVRNSRLHHRVVTLLEDYAPRRRFADWGMRLLNIRASPQEQIVSALHGALKPGVDLPCDDRAFRLIRAFAAGRWRDHAMDGDDPARWTFRADPASVIHAPLPLASDTCQFALQPIVDTTAGRISSLEALMRGPTGGSPQSCFEALSPEQYHLFDLEAKCHAFELVERMGGIGKSKLSINLLPMSLVRVPDAVDYLLDQIARHGLTPERVILEITEEEAISHFDLFQTALKQLRAHGVSLAIDDFGAGFAGLSLLSRFQPDKLKIDRQIVQGIHADGPRQAIVRAIISCCSALGITIVAEGVETPEEWSWLQAAGIDLFQGFLFARPMLNGIPAVNWPVPVAETR